MRVAVEGLIGAGKSTLLSLVDGSTQEAVGAWAPLLERFYADSARWGFALQMQVLLTQGNMPRGVSERSPHSALHVFARDTLDGLEIGLLEAWTRRHGWVPDAVVFLRADPELCLARVRRRARKGEEGVTLEYLRRLQAKYEAYLHMCRTELRIPVHVLEHDDPALPDLLRSFGRP